MADKKKCLWSMHKRFENFVRPSCQPISITITHAQFFKFCPYCGKKIGWDSSTINTEKEGDDA